MELKSKNRKVLNHITLNETKEHLDMELLAKDFDRSCRIDKSNSKNESRPIVVKSIHFY